MRRNMILTLAGAAAGTLVGAVLFASAYWIGEYHGAERVSRAAWHAYEASRPALMESAPTLAAAQAIIDAGDREWANTVGSGIEATWLNLTN